MTTPLYNALENTEISLIVKADPRMQVDKKPEFWQEVTSRGEDGGNGS